MQHSCPVVRRRPNCDRSGARRELQALAPATRDETALLLGRTRVMLSGHAGSQEIAGIDGEYERTKAFRRASPIPQACCNKQVRRCSICYYSLRKHFTQDARLVPVKPLKLNRQDTKRAKTPDKNDRAFIRTESGPGSRRGQPAWGGGSDRLNAQRSFFSVDRLRSALKTHLLKFSL